MGESKTDTRRFRSTISRFFLVIIKHLFFYFELPSLHTLSCLLVFACALQ